MKVIPQYKVIGPCNYDRIIHVIKKLMVREKIEVTVKRKHADSLNINICVISKIIVSKHYDNEACYQLPVKDKIFYGQEHPGTRATYYILELNS